MGGPIVIIGAGSSGCVLAMRLTEKSDREVLLLSRFQELSFAEISGILECSVGAAKVRAHRALRELREVYFQLQKNRTA